MGEEDVKRYELEPSWEGPRSRAEMERMGMKKVTRSAVFILRTRWIWCLVWLADYCMECLLEY